MSSAATRDDRVPDQGSAPAAAAVAPPPKLRRRPGLVAAGIAVICVGALIAAWAWTSTTNTDEVLVARQNIERGQVISADDLVRVRVSADPALRPVPSAELEQVVGQRAAFDIAQGAMLTPGSFSSAVVPAGGTSVVGVALTPAQAPGLELHAGDQVRVIVTPAQGDDAPAGAPLFSQAEIVGVRVSEETGQSVVDLLVPHSEAAVLAARVATGNVALVLDSRER